MRVKRYSEKTKTLQDYQTFRLDPKGNMFVHKIWADNKECKNDIEAREYAIRLTILKHCRVVDVMNNDLFPKRTFVGSVLKKGNEWLWIIPTSDKKLNKYGTLGKAYKLNKDGTLKYNRKVN